jgi:hypothetical protein
LYCSWFQKSLANKFLDLELGLFEDEALFTLCGIIAKVTHWCFKNPHAHNDSSLHDLKILLWCEVSECKFIGLVSFEETINSDTILQGIDRR